jgi:hypothetical protein
VIQSAKVAAVAGAADPVGRADPTGPQGVTGAAGSGGTIGIPCGAGNGQPTTPPYPGGVGTLPVAPCSGFASSTWPSVGDLSDFFAILDSPDLSIQAPVGEPEAVQSINLFSVVNVYLGGVSTRRVGNKDKMDVLGMLTLYYGLQDKSLTPKIVISTPELWTELEDELKSLRDDLDLLGSDVVFLAREARRQFNLGFNHDVLGNTEFPTLFQRYVDLANNPLLALDLSVEQASPFANKTQVARAYDLFAELKDLTIGIVRTLSRNGTVATSQINEQWADYEKRALTVLKKVADARISEDADELRILSVVADLIDKDLSNDIAPYIALARDGGCLLSLALEAYRTSVNQLDKYDRAELLRVFQNGTPDAFLTTRIRNRALVVKKYPLRNWG